MTAFRLRRATEVAPLEVGNGLVVIGRAVETLECGHRVEVPRRPYTGTLRFGPARRRCLECGRADAAREAAR